MIVAGHKATEWQKIWVDFNAPFAGNGKQKISLIAGNSSIEDNQQPSSEQEKVQRLLRKQVHRKLSAMEMGDPTFVGEDIV